jgi:hypothetical protein
VTTTPYPMRLRLGLYGDRGIHAARQVVNNRDIITACGYVLGPDDERKPNDTPVTCTTCIRRAS